MSLAFYFTVTIFLIFTPLTSLAESSISYLGFTINISDKAEKNQSTAQAIDIIKKQIVYITEKNSKFKALTTKTQFWLTDSQWTNTTAVVTHVSKEWLIEQKMDLRLYGNIEVLNIKNFAQWSTKYQPMMTVHELAHAYQYFYVGWYHPLIKDTYNKAMDQNLYQNVPYLRPDGKKMKAYAATNEHEYFSELTETYFGPNEFFPFNKTQLAEYDPNGLKMLERVWGK